MIIFLHGPDSYRIKEKLNEIVKSYQKVHKSGLNLSYIRFDEAKGDLSVLNGFKNSFRQVSMFREKKLAVLINPFSNSGSKDQVLDCIDDFIKSDDLIVILEEKALAKNDKALKILNQKAKCQEFPMLTGAKLTAWVKKESDIYGAKFKDDAVELLLMNVGNDLWQLSQEVKKLACYKKGKEINCADVELLVRLKTESDIFKTIDAIALKNKKEALKLIHRHIENGDSPLYVLSMINYQFRNLLAIKDLQEKGNSYELIAKKSGLHPFVVRKSFSQLQNFSFNDLKKIYLKIFQVDLDIKTGKADHLSALDLLVAEI
jgi:DNA polymerase-3 subunit delta